MTGSRLSRKPELLGSNTASHAGSSPALTNACFALSSMVGMPRGRFPWFWYPHSSNRLCLLVFPMLWMNLVYHSEAILGIDVFYSVNPCCFLPLVILGHLSHCQQPCCLRFHQAFLNCSFVSTLPGSRDAFLHAKTVFLQLAPGNRVPSLPRRIHLCGAFLFAIRLTLFRATPTVSTSAYLPAFPGALAS